MDAIGAAASLLALAELATKVSLACNNYYRAVKNANEEISRLESRLQNLQQILVKAAELYGDFSNGHQQIAANMPLYLKSCNTQLTDVHSKLQPSSGSLLGMKKKLEKLAWPFKERQMSKLIGNLAAIQQDILLAMQIDQSATLKGLQATQDHLLLPIAEGASFDSFSDQLNARCHDQTRVEIRQQIRDWFTDPGGSGIFWLNGMAGTGKSTILRSMAQEFHDHQQLGASFFFKRGEGNRGDASRFITTIAKQLSDSIPRLGIFVRDAVKLQPQIYNKTMAEQVQQLFLQPLEKYVLQDHSPFVVVVDALDECDDTENAKLIVQLLSQLAISSDGTARLLLSSRPESPIRLAFNRLTSTEYTSLALQDVLESVIRHDLEIYIRHELAVIRDDHRDDISLDWPAEKQIERLVEIVHPLFIAAATACRFISDPRWDPEQQLEIILEDDNVNQSHQLARVYHPILSQMLADLNDKQKAAIIDEFRLVVGSVIVLEDALSVNALAALLRISKRTIKSRLAMLHSVVQVPTDDNQPVKLLHLSFRNFLVAADLKGNPFAIDEPTAHQRIGSACLDLLSSTDCLKQDICDFENPAMQRKDINNNVVFTRIPPEVRYASNYWLNHIRDSNSFISNEGLIYRFLKTRFIYWLEALVLLGRHFNAKTILAYAQSLCLEENSFELKQFLHDAVIFCQNTQSMLDMYPLQLYCSGLMFTPKRNAIRTIFENCIPATIKELPVARDLYYDSTKSFAYHTGDAHSIALSLDGKQFATSSRDGLVKIWETVTGHLQHILYGQNHGGIKIEFILGDNRLLSHFERYEPIFLWNTEKGSLEKTWKGKLNGRWNSTSSHSGQLLAIWTVYSRSSLELLDLQTGRRRSLDHGENRQWDNVQFSQDDTRLAVLEDLRAAVIFDVSTGSKIFVFELPVSIRKRHVLALSASGLLIATSGGESICIWSLISGNLSVELPTPRLVLGLTFFSDDSRLLCTVADAMEVWNLDTCSLDSDYEGCKQPFAFSKDGNLLFTRLQSGGIGRWNVRTHRIEQTLPKNLKSYDAMVVSHDVRHLLFRTSKSIDLWDIVEAKHRYSIGRAKTEVSSIQLSPDTSRLAVSLLNGITLIWDLSTATIIHRLDGCEVRLFSPTGRYWAVVGTGEVDIWDAERGAICLTIPCTHYLAVLAFAPDESLVMTKEMGANALLWSTVTGERIQTFQDDLNTRPTSAAFSSDSKRSITLCVDNIVPQWSGTIRVWSHETGALIRAFDVPEHRGSSGIFVFADHMFVLWLGHIYLFVYSTDKDDSAEDFCAIIFIYQFADRAYIEGGLSLKISLTGAEVHDLSSCKLIESANLPQGRFIRSSHLLFAADFKYLQHDPGLASSMDGDILKFTRRRDRIDYHRDWLLVDDKPTLWLPTQYRATSTSIRQGKVALAFMSGEIIILDHDTGDFQYLKLPETEKELQNGQELEIRQRTDLPNVKS